MSQIGLVVLHPFLGYAAGKLITDAEEIAQATAEYPAHAVRRLLTDAEAEAAALEAKAKEDFRAVVHGAEAAETAVVEPVAVPITTATLTIPETPVLA